MVCLCIYKYPVFLIPPDLDVCWKQTWKQAQSLVSTKETHPLTYIHWCHSSFIKIIMMIFKCVSDVVYCDVMIVSIYIYIYIYIVFVYILHCFVWCYGTIHISPYYHHDHDHRHHHHYHHHTTTTRITTSTTVIATSSYHTTIKTYTLHHKKTLISHHKTLVSHGFIGCVRVMMWWCKTILYNIQYEIIIIMIMIMLWKINIFDLVYI